MPLKRPFLEKISCSKSEKYGKEKFILRMVYRMQTNKPVKNGGGCCGLNNP